MTEWLLVLVVGGVGLAGLALSVIYATGRR